MIVVVIPVNCFILFHYGLVHCGTLSWFANKGEYHSNTRAFFTIVEKLFKLDNEITVQLEDQVCSIEICDVCSNNKYATIEDNDHFIDFRSIKNSHAKINEKKDKYHLINGHLNLLGLVVLESDILMEDKYDISLEKLSIVKLERYWQKLIHTDSQRSILFPRDIPFFV